MTHVQRLDSILTGILDVAPTNAQTLKVANAFVATLSDQEILRRFGVSREEMTNAQKAQVTVEMIRNIVKIQVRDSSIASATATAHANAVAQISDL